MKVGVACNTVMGDDNGEVGSEGVGGASGTGC